MRTTIRNVVVLAVAALPAQEGGGGGNKYRVKNMTTGEASEDLQAQIDAASNGDTLKIKGVCVGNFAISAGADLTLLGAEKGGLQATLDGGGGDQVLYIAGDYTNRPSVTLTNLTITGAAGGNRGGGIYNSVSTASMVGVGVMVTGNIADADNNDSGEGGGIYGCVEGAVGGGNVDDNCRRTDSSQVEDNIANGCP